MIARKERRTQGMEGEGRRTVGRKGRRKEEGRKEGRRKEGKKKKSKCHIAGTNPHFAGIKMLHLTKPLLPKVNLLIASFYISI